MANRRKSNKRKAYKSEKDESLDLDLSISGKNNLLISSYDDETNDTLTKMANSTRQIENMKEVFLLDEDDLSSKKIISANMVDHKVPDRFRDLRTTLLNVSKNKNFMLMVTSVCESGGASVIATNLAAAFSFDDSKTSLLIDCNLRNPKLDKMFDVNTNKGLTNYLEDKKINIDEIISNTGIKRLRLITAGKNKESTSEYFTSARMIDLLNKIQERYSDRYIIIDAPPIGESPDATILADLCDFVLAVVPYGKVTISNIEKSLKTIDKKKLVGVVFNN
ncbi:Tyrosine-protein kinase EpsD [hydrothermal vent metagenome]|uniref:Tyrosine-protein kinase EpsD n=1 Tax=hydrothermal vent metagenome TaxID=652676 RepID=A0A3B0ZP27_9ZZZZ